MIYLLIFFSLLYLKTQKGQEFTTCKSETLPKNIVFDKEVEKLYYFEVVDGKSFLYCKDCVFESKLRLYEFERLSAETKFLRTSKSMVLNGDKIDFIKPSLSGRFEVTLLNGEKVIVSRQYVNALKKKMGL
ncbi:MAG: LytTR family transcriptional regulator [Emergencia sp.]|jgi:DNA-binding LytR/AlgR family response regulator|nr:LytTR family transcriptional regulator [Emergencia sp.]